MLLLYIFFLVLNFLYKIQESTQQQDEEKQQEQKGDKRKRSSPSPDRSQRRRSRSPIKEDEPPIDNDKVQLSWCK